MKHYHVGYNMPNYDPTMEPYTVKTLREARAAVQEEIHFLTDWCEQENHTHRAYRQEGRVADGHVYLYARNCAPAGYEIVHVWYSDPCNDADCLQEDAA